MAVDFSKSKTRENLMRAFARESQADVYKRQEPGLAEKIYYMSIPEAALYMRTRYGLEQSVEEISQGIKDVVRDFYYYEAPLKAGVKEFLQKMSNRKIPVVAATASDEDLSLIHI